jgi:dehydrogenase/reductase SDR family member 7B
MKTTVRIAWTSMAHLFWPLLWSLLVVAAVSSFQIHRPNYSFSATRSGKRRRRSFGSHVKHHGTTTTAAMAAASSIVQSSTSEAFRGTNVLITGASSGLGQALAVTLAQQCHVRTLILSARRSDALEQVADQCRRRRSASGAESSAQSPALTVHIVPCDLADPVSVANLGQKAIALCGTINVLINNGGVSSRSAFIDTDIAVDERIMQINFLAGAALAKTVVPTMMNSNSKENENVTKKKTKNRIIWISSVQGLVGIPHRSSYAASKFAVQGYCESIRAELHGHNIDVHSVSPGYINTNLSQSAVTGDGGAYCRTDETTSAGADPDELAVTILDQVAAGAVDFTVAAPVSARAAVWMKLFCPGLLRHLLVRRYEKTMTTTTTTEPSPRAKLD